MSEFNYTDERFADIQILRYKLKGFEDLSLKQKTLIYYLSQATLLGRDITTDQFGRYNLKIRKVLELIFLHYTGNKQDSFFQDLSVYLKRVWFSNGIHHHYGSDKFQPCFSENDFRKAVLSLPINLLPLEKDEKIEVFLDTICKVIFDNSYLQKFSKEENLIDKRIEILEKGFEKIKIETELDDDKSNYKKSVKFQKEFEEKYDIKISENTFWYFEKKQDEKEVKEIQGDKKEIIKEKDDKEIDF